MDLQEGLSVGTMIEKQLEAAGVGLATSYKLVMLDMPGIEMGDLTVDVTNRSRLFRNYMFRNLLCATGMPYTVGGLSREVVEEAIAMGDIHTGRVSLKAFHVDIKESSLVIGRMRPNASVCVACRHCNRTYHQDELQIGSVAQGHKFFCKTCLTEAMKKYESMSKRERKKTNSKKPTRYMFRLDRERNIVRYEKPPLSKRMKDELIVAAATLPEDGGELRLPRPFVMFEPGTSKVVWEPEENDLVGQQLKERCARVIRGSVRGQQPVPLEKVLEAYAPKGWDRRPWIRQGPLKVPGIIGVQLLVDHRLAGWVPIENLKPDVNRYGWWREFPEDRAEVEAREV